MWKKRLEPFSREIRFLWKFPIKTSRFGKVASINPTFKGCISRPWRTSSLKHYVSKIYTVASHISTVTWLDVYSGATLIIRTFESYRMTQRIKDWVTWRSRYERFYCNAQIYSINVSRLMLLSQASQEWPFYDWSQLPCTQNEENRI